jgi:hypothetical protein
MHPGDEAFRNEPLDHPYRIIDAKFFHELIIMLSAIRQMINGREKIFPDTYADIIQ